MEFYALGRARGLLAGLLEYCAQNKRWAGVAARGYVQGGSRPPANRISAPHSGLLRLHPPPCSKPSRAFATSLHHINSLVVK